MVLCLWTLLLEIPNHVSDLTMLPLSLLRTAQNHPMLVELKNGETYNGHLVSCDNWMNINLREVSGECAALKKYCYLKLDTFLKAYESHIF